MDREDAIRLLRDGREGIGKWNAIPWRERDVDLSNANLAEADLEGVILVGTNLIDTNLSRANLEAAQLREASLIRANLEQANLFGANLLGANLSEANLTGANLKVSQLAEAKFSGANLKRCSLSGANLYAANFRGAILDGALFGHTSISDVDLSEAKGLEEVRHMGPSSIGLDTLDKSGGTIPDTFLRRCGVREDWITFIPSLVGTLSPIDFYSSFISYSTNDEQFCKRLHGRLTQDKLRVWLAPEDMKRGQKIHEQIESAIRVHDKLLLVLSEQSMASGWVEHEIYTARQREEREGRKVLFPVALCSFDSVKKWKCFDADTGRDMAREIREYYIPDFSSWKDHDSFEAEYDKLLRDLKKTAEDEQAHGS